MASVIIKAGRYFVGDPTTVFPDFELSPSCTYRAGAHIYHAFEFGDNIIAAIPEEALPKKDKKLKLLKFDTSSIFFVQESTGTGAIGMKVLP